MKVESELHCHMIYRQTRQCTDEKETLISNYFFCQAIHESLKNNGWIPVRRSDFSMWTKHSVFRINDRNGSGPDL